MAWRIAKSLEVLRDEVNTRWPDRNKASDGFIGNAAHAASASDHNPNPYGVVCAFDITHDPAGCDGNYLAELIRTHRHPDVKYVIWDHRLFSSYGATPWEWRPYHGADPHTNHVHVSVGVGTDGQSQPPYDDLDQWGVFPSSSLHPAEHPPGTPITEDDMTPAPVTLPDGTGLVFAVGDDRHCYEYTAPDTFRDLGGEWTSGLSAQVLLKPDGTLDAVHIWGRGLDGGLYYLRREPDGTFGQAVPWGGHLYPAGV